MSSATSIERDLEVTADGAAGAEARETSQGRARDPFQPWHFFVLLSLLAATAAVIMARNSRPEHLVLISLTIGAAGFAAGALYRTLVPLVGDDSFTTVTPLNAGRRAELEREKGLILRALKELEFDRAMGKVSPRDFDEMGGRLRTRAMAVMRQLDSGGEGYRELIERELNARLRRASVAARTGAGPGQRGAPTPISASARRCSCGSLNDPDAAFCKRCGTKLQLVTTS